MDRLSDAAKLAMFDDLAEERNENERCIAELRAELDRCNKRFKALAWSLECALSIAHNLPMPNDEEELLLAKVRLNAGLEHILIRRHDMTFDEWWKQTKPAECDELKPYFVEAWEIAATTEREACAKIADAKDDMMEYGAGEEIRMRSNVKVTGSGTESPLE